MREQGSEQVDTINTQAAAAVRRFDEDAATIDRARPDAVRLLDQREAGDVWRGF